MRRPIGGMLYMAGATLTGVAADATVKHLALDGVAAGVLMTLRNLVQVLSVAMLAWLLRARIRPPQRWSLHAGRGLCLALTSFTMIVSLRELPMTQVYAIGFSSPLLVAVLARLLLGETCNARQWTCIVIGFCGVLIALRPAAPLLAGWLAYPVLYALFSSSFAVLTRVGRDEGLISLGLWSALIALLCCVATLPWTFAPIPRGSLGLLALVGLGATVTQLLMIQAYRLAPAYLVAPMLYLQILWATIAGIFGFGEMPGLHVLVGAAVVGACGFALLAWATPADSLDD